MILGLYDDYMGIEDYMGITCVYIYIYMGLTKQHRTTANSGKQRQTTNKGNKMQKTNQAIEIKKQQQHEKANNNKQTTNNEINKNMGVFHPQKNKINSKIQRTSMETQSS